jgi:hypothetical protein
VCLGQTQREEALFYLQQLMMQKKNLLNGKKVQEGKLQAVAGLQGMATLHAFKILQGVAADAKEDAEVVSAARKAMYAVKKLLFEPAQPQRPKTGSAPSEEATAAAAANLFDQFQAAKKDAADAADAEKQRIAAAIKAREAAEAAEAARREQERQEGLARPFGLDPVALASLAAQPAAPAKPPPLPGQRPATGATRVTETGPGSVSPHVANTQPRVSAGSVPNTSPRIDATGKVLPPAPPPAAQAVGDEDPLEFDFDVDEEGG